MLTVPTWQRKEDGVVYEFQFEDAVHRKKWKAGFRYKELQQFYETLLDYKLKKHLVEFPETPFWKFWVNVQSDSKLIEERREALEEFFQHILHNKHTKTHKLIVNFVKIAHQRGQGPELVEKEPGSPEVQTYSPTLGPQVSAHGTPKSATFKHSPLFSPTHQPLVKSKSLYGFTFSKGTKRKQSYAVLNANSLVGSRLGRKLSQQLQSP